MGKYIFQFFFLFVYIFVVAIYCLLKNTTKNTCRSMLGGWMNILHTREDVDVNDDEDEKDICKEDKQVQHLK